MQKTDYKIIDFHCHVFPDKVAKKAADRVGTYYSLKMNGDGTAKTLVKSALDEKLDVRGLLIHSSATKPEQVESVNNFIAALMRKNSLFIGFGTIHDEYENPQKELQRIKKLGLHGLKLHPDFQNFCIDDDSMMKIYEIAESESLPVLFHVGDKNTDKSSPKRLARVVDAFPKLKVIAAHMGGYSAWDDAVRYLYGKNIWLDTSSTMQALPYNRVLELIRMHGADKILFGSDYPIKTTSQAADDIMQLRLTEKEREMIFCKNAELLLNMR